MLTNRVAKLQLVGSLRATLSHFEYLKNELQMSGSLNGHFIFFSKKKKEIGGLKL